MCGGSGKVIEMKGNESSVKRRGMGEDARVDAGIVIAAENRIG